MVSAVAMMVGGAVLNATFVGGSYLAKYLSGNDSKEVLYEKDRHDAAYEEKIGRMRIEVAMLLHLITLLIQMRL